VGDIRGAACREYRDPPTVERAAEGKDLLTMLMEGELDAAVVGSVPDDPRLKTLIPDPAAAARDWHARNQALQINHMVVVKESLSEIRPAAGRRSSGCFWRAARQRGCRRGRDRYEPVRPSQQIGRNLEVAIEYVYQQRLIPRRFEVDELFDDVTRALGGEVIVELNS